MRTLIVKYYQPIIMLLIGGGGIVLGYYNSRLNIMEWGKWIVFLAILGFLMTFFDLNNKIIELSSHFNDELKFFLESRKKRHVDRTNGLVHSNSESLEKNKTKSVIDIEKINITAKRIQKTKEEVKLLLESDKLNDAITSIDALCKEFQIDDLSLECSSLKGRLNNILEIEYNNTQSFNIIRQEKNRIGKSIISLLQQLDRELYS